MQTFFTDPKVFYRTGAYLRVESARKCHVSLQLWTPATFLTQHQWTQLEWSSAAARTDSLLCDSESLGHHGASAVQQAAPGISSDHPGGNQITWKWRRVSGASCGRSQHVNIVYACTFIFIGSKTTKNQNKCCLICLLNRFVCEVFQCRALNFLLSFLYQLFCLSKSLKVQFNS